MKKEQPAPEQPLADPEELTADTITDKQIRALQNRLHAGPADDRQLYGVVACIDARGRSHRRRAARTLCAEIHNALRKETTQ